MAAAPPTAADAGFSGSYRAGGRHLPAQAGRAARRPRSPSQGAADPERAAPLFGDDRAGKPAGPGLSGALPSRRSSATAPGWRGDIADSRRRAGGARRRPAGGRHRLAGPGRDADRRAAAPGAGAARPGGAPLFDQHHPRPRHRPGRRCAHIAARHDPARRRLRRRLDRQGRDRRRASPRASPTAPFGFRPFLAVVADPAGRADLAATRRGLSDPLRPPERDRLRPGQPHRSSTPSWSGRATSTPASIIPNMPRTTSRAPSSRRSTALAAAIEPPPLRPRRAPGRKRRRAATRRSARSWRDYGVARPQPDQARDRRGDAGGAPAGSRPPAGPRPGRSRRSPPRPPRRWKGSSRSTGCPPESSVTGRSASSGSCSRNEPNVDMTDAIALGATLYRARRPGSDLARDRRSAGATRSFARPSSAWRIRSGPTRCRRRCATSRGCSTALARATARGPMLFIRPRDPAMLEAHAQAATGSSGSTASSSPRRPRTACPTYLRLRRPRRITADADARDPRDASTRSRSGACATSSSAIQARVLAIRIGGNDLLQTLGARRSAVRTAL